MKKECAICGKEFDAQFVRQNVCGFDCRQEKVRQNAREKMRQYRNLAKEHGMGPCVVCGWKETTDIHHEGKGTYVLCPNHHALLTRGIKTLDEIMEQKISTVK